MAIRKKGKSSPGKKKTATTKVKRPIAHGKKATSKQEEAVITNDDDEQDDSSDSLQVDNPLIEAMIESQEDEVGTEGEDDSDDNDNDDTPILVNDNEEGDDRDGW